MSRFIPFLLLLAACPSPEKPNDTDSGEPDSGDTGPGDERADFGDATSEQRAEALLTGLGFGGVFATFAQFQADADARSVDEDNEPSGCPAYEVLDDEPYTVRYTADDCVGPSGARWDGVLTAVNPFTWETTGEGPMELTFEGFTLDDGMDVQRYEGTFAQSDLRMGEDSVATYDLLAEIGESAWYTKGSADISWSDGVSRTVCADGTVGSVGGLGDFDVACDATGFGERDGTGFVELVGADTLRVTLTPDGEGCFPATVDGVAVEPICLDLGGGGGGEDLDDSLFGGSGMGCVDDELFLFDAETVTGEVAHVDLFLAAAGGGPVEQHAVPATDPWSEGYDLWMSELPLGTYVPGESTALTCDDMDDLHAVFVAYDDSDEVVGCRWAANTREAGPIDIAACPRL